MSDGPPDCLRCHSPMEQGYMVDRGHMNSANVAGWIEGTPDVRWYGIKAAESHRIPVVAFRCVKCGYVELRAAQAKA